MPSPRILVFAGSTRSGSWNKKLASLGAAFAREAGASVTQIDLRDFPMPLYDGDLEQSAGIPENARKFKQLLRDHDGFLIASPEYNSSITGVLKNSIDWASRAESDDEPPLVAYRGKVAALVSASPGALGGLRGLVHLRSILGNIGMIVLPDQLSISVAHEAFDDSAKLKDARKAGQLQKIVESLVRVAGKLSS